MKFKTKKDSNKAMVVAWSDSKTSDSETDEEYATNICLMAKKVQDNERLESMIASMK